MGFAAFFAGASLAGVFFRGGLVPGFVAFLAFWAGDGFFWGKDDGMARPKGGCDGQIRTAGIRGMNPALYQLSYTAMAIGPIGDTNRKGGQRSVLHTPFATAMSPYDG